MPSGDGYSALGRPPSPAADDAILQAAMALLRERGPEGVSVASVASRSGVARTTIYRRYSNREELLTAALRMVTVRGRPASDLPTASKLDWLLDETVQVLSAGIGLGGVASVIAAEDPTFVSAVRRALVDGLAPVREQATSDVTSGRLRVGTDPDALIDLVLGAYLAEVLLHGAEPRPGWRERTQAMLETFAT